MERDKRAVVKGSHVLVLPMPAQGHINPMLQFSKRLAAKGIKVTLVTTSSYLNAMQGEQALAMPINVEPIFDGFREGERVAGVDDYLERFKATVPGSLAEVIKKHSSTQNPPRCLIYDSLLPWAVDVAQDSGIHAATFFTQPCAVSVIYYHELQGSLKFPLMEPVVKLPSLPDMEFNDLPTFVYGPGSYPGLYDLVFSRFSNIDKATWVLWNTFDDLEDELVKWMKRKWPIKTIGPTIPSMFLDQRLEDDKDYGLSLFKPKSEACMEWLDSKSPHSVVYVSFGSVARLEEAQMAELAWGLKRSNYSFLWVVRETELEKLPRSFIEETSDSSLIVTWCNQMQVLAHRSIGCFVTHCGWNSTIEALGLGVPMVAMPQWTDQPTNAKFVADVWGVGVRVKVDGNGTIVTNEEIERCLREVMVEGERGIEIRQNSGKWKELARKAVDGGGSSEKNIEDFVGELMSNSYSIKE
ncbi:hypothetical protein Tsubulata_030063 [Turnera subulata]|uniref:Glycosyltransferase n=1 Tax=Turnera subulata TaxID=218843 RepID=A0A9Q0FLG1_9ROSI|nr:hypothetical protein Tsubulata_030063 [Turnera subulata]